MNEGFGVDVGFGVGLAVGAVGLGEGRGEGMVGEGVGRGDGMVGFLVALGSWLGLGPEGERGEGRGGGVKEEREGGRGFREGWKKDMMTMAKNIA